jgi:hypothetical protein
MPREHVENGRVALSQSERLKLSERDSLRVLDLLENPPASTARLTRAAKGGFMLESQRGNGKKIRSTRTTTASAHPFSDS